MAVEVESGQMAQREVPGREHYAEGTSTNAHMSEAVRMAVDGVFRTHLPFLLKRKGVRVPKKR